jgi:transcriptional regulator with XRE-family HTH domain
MGTDHQSVGMSIDVTDIGTPLTERVAEEIRAWMGRRRLSQAELARQLGVSKMWVSYRLNAVQPIDLNDLHAIARVLKVGVADLLPSDVRRTAQSKDGTLTPPVRPSDNRPNGRPDRAVTAPGDNRPGNRPDRGVTAPGGPRRTRRLAHREPMAPLPRVA